jgi:hypothetical protein
MGLFTFLVVVSYHALVDAGVFIREKADLKKGFQHLVVVVVCTLHKSKNAFRLLKGTQCEMLKGDTV